MQVQLVGIQKINFTNNNGQEIKGVNLHVVFASENVEGLQVERFFLKDGINLPKDTKLNDTINICFNHKGKIEEVSKVNK